MIYSRSNLNRHIADVHFFLIFDAARQVSTETRIRSRVKCKTSKITKLSKTDKDANQHFQFQFFQKYILTDKNWKLTTGVLLLGIVPKIFTHVKNFSICKNKTRRNCEQIIYSLLEGKVNKILTYGVIIGGIWNSRTKSRILISISLFILEDKVDGNKSKRLKNNQISNESQMRTRTTDRSTRATDCLMH